MRENKKRSFDWDNFIETFSEISHSRKAMDLIYEQTKEMYSREIPDFNIQFIKKLRDASFNERKDFYAYKISQSGSTINGSIEELPDLIAEIASSMHSKDDPPELIEFLNYNDLLKEFFTWCEYKDEKMKYTLLYFYSLNKYEPDGTLEYKDRLFILETLVKFGVLEDGEMSKGGESLCKLLAIILDAPYQSLERPLRSINKFCDFDKMKYGDDAIKAKLESKRLDIISNVIKEACVEKHGNVPYFKKEYNDILNFLDGLKKAYENKFLDHKEKK